MDTDRRSSGKRQEIIQKSHPQPYDSNEWHKKRNQTINEPDSRFYSCRYLMHHDRHHYAHRLALISVKGTFMKISDSAIKAMADALKKKSAGTSQKTGADVKRKPAPAHLAAN